MVVLALLVESPMHVYRMQQLIKERGKDKVVNVAQRNSIHQALARLERDGLVRVKETKHGEGRPERTVYEATSEGTKTVRVWVCAMLAKPSPEYPDFPAALAFLMLLEPDDARAQLTSRAQAVRESLSETKAAGDQARGFGLPRLFLVEDEYRIAMMEAELTWVEAIIDALASGELTWSETWIRQIAIAMEGPR
jgi:DNA-binding PadR family transcriptional regulator